MATIIDYSEPSDVVPKFDVDPKTIDLLYEYGTCPTVREYPENQDLILRCGQSSTLVTVKMGVFTLVERSRAYGITPRNAEQIFAMHHLLDPAIKLVTLRGKAGTGKTLLALAAALESKQEYRQILLSRPVVPLNNKDNMGYLPGDVKDKLDPYMQPLWDNLAVIKETLGNNNPAAERIQGLLEDNKLVITPLSFIRGRSLSRAFLIVDEAQNLCPLELKTIITRAGEGTKIVLTGDTDQIDNHHLRGGRDGFTHVIDRFRGHKLNAYVRLRKGERSELADAACELL